jgi:membrane-bound ClpP family serine protease
MKGEVISKAQKIIERLTGKSDSDEKVLARLNEENESHKREGTEREKVVTLLNDQLKEVSAK